jgi:hypothetical protein
MKEEGKQTLWKWLRALYFGVFGQVKWDMFRSTILGTTVLTLNIESLPYSSDLCRVEQKLD